MACLNANQFCLLRDDHNLGVFINRKHRDNLSGFLSRLHIDDALTAARLQPVSSYQGLLAITLLRDRQHSFLIICRHGTDRNYEVVLP